jgi:hypothetical protein
MLKFNSDDDFILYNESGNVILTGVNTGVNNIYSITKPHVLTGNDLEYAKRVVEEHFTSNFRILLMFLTEYTEEEIFVKMSSNFWRTCGLLNAHITIDKAMQMIGNGLAHNFEFKVENQRIYWRKKL